MERVTYTKQVIGQFLGQKKYTVKTYLDLTKEITNEGQVIDDEQKSGEDATSEQEQKTKLKIVEDVYNYFLRNKERLDAYGIDESIPVDNVYIDYQRLKSMEPETLTKRIIQQFFGKKDYKKVYDGLKSLNSKSHIISINDVFKGKRGVTIKDKQKEDKVIENVYDFFRKKGNKLTQRGSILNPAFLDYLYQEFTAFELEHAKRKIDDEKFKMIQQIKKSGNDDSTYDMSYLFREDYLAKKSQDGKIRRLVVPMEEKDNDTREYTMYKDSSGKKIGIKMLNTILYKTPNGVVKSVNKYSIAFGNEDEHYDIYSTIDIMQMESNEEYRKAVLEHLLKKENILLTNAEGYIGAIEPITEEDETKGNNGYSLPVSKHYSLRYDAEDLSAVVALRIGLNKPHDDTLEQTDERILTSEEAAKYIKDKAREGEVK